MKLLKRNNTASVLFEKVKSLREDRLDTWRCIHMEFSETGTQANQPLRTQFMGRITADLLANEEGYIYLCDDGDIFILFKGALRPVLRKLSGYFDDFDPSRLSHRGSNGQITVFDLGHNWHSFFELCRSKARKDMAPQNFSVTSIPMSQMNGYDG